MRKSCLTEPPIFALLKEGEACRTVAEISRKHGIGKNKYFTRKSRYGGVTVSDLKRLKEL